MGGREPYIHSLTGRENKSLRHAQSSVSVLSYNSALASCACAYLSQRAARAAVQRLSIFSPVTGRLPLYPTSEATLGSPVVHQIVAVLR